MSRFERRAKKSAFAKELKGAKFDSWEDVTALAVMDGRMTKLAFGSLIFFKKNSIYSVQAYKYKNSDMTLIGIRRHDEKPICPWSHKQRIKNELFGPEREAIELFPRESKLSDQANMYWLWIYPEDEGSGFDLRG